MLGAHFLGVYYGRVSQWFLMFCASQWLGGLKQYAPALSRTYWIRGFRDYLRPSVLYKSSLSDSQKFLIFFRTIGIFVLTTAFFPKRHLVSHWQFEFVSCDLRIAVGGVWMVSCLKRRCCFSHLPSIPCSLWHFHILTRCQMFPLARAPFCGRVWFVELGHREKCQKRKQK